MSGTKMNTRTQTSKHALMHTQTHKKDQMRTCMGEKYNLRWPKNMLDINIQWAKDVAHHIALPGMCTNHPLWALIAVSDLKEKVFLKFCTEKVLHIAGLTSLNIWVIVQITKMTYVYSSSGL